MQLVKFLSGYPDLIGRRQAFVGVFSGPTSYTASATAPLTGGDTLVIPGYEKYIDSITEISIDTLGNYFGVAKPSIAGARATWTIFYYNAATGAIIQNLTGGNSTLTTAQFLVSGFMGEY